MHVIAGVAPRYGGPSETALSMVSHLLALGVDAQIATTDADGPGRLHVETGRLTRWHSLPVRFFPRRFGESLKYSREMARWLESAIGGFDIVHVHGVFSHPSVAAARACAAHGIPYILRPLGNLDPVSLATRAARKRVFLATWGSGIMNEAAALHYTTHREKAAVEARFAPPSGFVVPIGIVPGEAAAAAAIGGGPYVLFLGRLHPIKNIELLMDAFACASGRAALRHWRLVVAGDGEPGYTASLRARARELGADERIVFTGWLGGEDKAAALAGADLIALVSKHENFGRAAAEGMAGGAPALLSSEVFLADDVAAHDAGWVVPADCGSVATALGEAMADNLVRRHRGERARRLVIERYCATRCAEALVRHYRAIAKCTLPMPGPAGTPLARAQSPRHT